MAIPRAEVPSCVSQPRLARKCAVMTAQTIRREIRNTVSFSSVRALFLFLGLLVLLGMIYLGQSSQATLTGQHVQDLQERLGRLKRENTQMEYDIAVLTTPVQIADRARALGLHPPVITQTLFITVKNYPVNPRPALNTNLPSTAANSDSLISALWNEVLVRLGIPPSGRTVEATSNP